MNENEVQNIVNLNKARNLKNAVNQATATVNSVRNPFYLLKQIRLGNDWPYIPAFFVALLKDLLDFIGLGSLPAIGTVVSLICSTFIFFMMLLAESGGKRKMAKSILKGPMGRFLLLGSGTVAEMLFGVNFMPVETLVVMMAYWMLLYERMIAEQENPQETD